MCYAAPLSTFVSMRLVREAGADGKHDGVMVALMLNTRANAEAVNALAKVATEPRDNQHITLAYCGKKAELTPVQIEAIHRVTSAVTKAHPALVGAVSGTGRFPASETSDGKDVYYAKPSIGGLTEMRQDLVTKLRAAGVPVSDKHPFNPHITLAYRDIDSAEPAIDAPHVPLTFGALTVVVGNDHTSHMLGGHTMRHAVQGVRESLSSFITRYTAPVAAVVREFNSTAGHWITAGGEEDGEGGGVHLFVSGSGGSKGTVTKGPKSLLGANIVHLSDGPHSIKHHPVDHTPPGAKDHPSYAEHKPATKAPIMKPEDAQESAIKNPGKPYARLHGADQGKGATSGEKGAAGASASAEEAHSAHEGPEPLTKEQAEAGLATARAESHPAGGLARGGGERAANAAPASSYDADPRDIAATAEFEKHKQQILSQHPDIKAHIDADTSHAGEAERWVNNEARTRLSPEHKRGSVTRNAQPYAKPQLPDAGATKATDERKAADDKEKMQAGARRMTEAAVARGKAMNDKHRAEVTRVQAAQAKPEASENKPAPAPTKAAIQAKVMAREKLTDAEKAFVLGGYKAPASKTEVAPKDAPKAEKAETKPDVDRSHLPMLDDKTPGGSTWRDLVNNADKVEESNGVTHHVSANAHYIVKGGHVYSAYGYHGQNLFDKISHPETGDQAERDLKAKQDDTAKAGHDAAEAIKGLTGALRDAREKREQGGGGYSAPKAAEKSAAEPKADNEGDVDNDYINRHLERHGDKSPAEKRWLAGNFEGQGSPEHAAAGLGGAPMHNQATRSKLAEILRGQADRADARAKEAYKAPEKPQDAPKPEAGGAALAPEHKAALADGKKLLAQAGLNPDSHKAKTDAAVAHAQSPYDGAVSRYARHGAERAQRMAHLEARGHYTNAADALDKQFAESADHGALRKMGQHHEMLTHVQQRSGQGAFYDQAQAQHGALLKASQAMTEQHMAAVKTLRAKADEHGAKYEAIKAGTAQPEGAKDTPKQAYTAPQAAGQGAGAAAPESYADKTKREYADFLKKREASQTNAKADNERRAVQKTADDEARSKGDAERMERLKAMSAGSKPAYTAPTAASAPSEKATEKLPVYNPDAPAEPHKSAELVKANHQPLARFERAQKRIEKTSLEDAGRANIADMTRRYGDLHNDFAPGHPFHEEVQQAAPTTGLRNAHVVRHDAYKDLGDKLEAEHKKQPNWFQTETQAEHAEAVGRARALEEHHRAEAERLYKPSGDEARKVQALAGKYRKGF